MESQQPFVERDVTIREDRPYGDGELLTASTTLPNALADVRILLGRLRLKTIGVIQFTTVRTDRAIRPSLLLEERPGLIFVTEVCG